MTRLFQPRRQAGFSLVEILVALFLLTIAVTAITFFFLGHTRLQDRVAQQYAAQSFLQETLDKLLRSAPLEEGTTSWEYGGEDQASVPEGLEAARARLVLEVEPWEEARPEERIQRVLLRLEWTGSKETRDAQVETLVGRRWP